MAKGKSKDSDKKPRFKEGGTLGKSKKDSGDFSAFQKKKEKKGDVLFGKIAKSFPDKLKKFEEDAERFADKKAGIVREEPKKELKKSVKDQKPVLPPAKFEENVRLNKYVAQSGICSRRAAAELVKAGEIKVNDVVNSDPSYVVKEHDVVSYLNKVLKVESKKIYILMNKPKNVITSSKDEKGRKTVLDLVQHKVDQRIYPVGRLDRNTTGLLLLTNDGDLSTNLAHPANMVKKIYLATLDKNLTSRDLEQIKEGLTLEDGKAEVDDVNFNDGKKDEIILTIHIGRNRIVRRIFEHLGYEVIKLDRIYYAGLTKKDLPRGFFRQLEDQEIIMLKHFSGKGKKI
ncbi:MAG TPA: pseudouridine synthase [Saprospiraceae bacterium]|nr:pseudouridine synthase [Saprospiraceae bacterium]HPN68907.1 pseudouridine synthase [Saprospiraceae bacterium]